LTIFTLAVGVVCGLAWTMAYMKGQSGAQQSQNTNNVRARTLRERAHEQDIEFDMREGHFDREYSDLRWLAKHSDAIVLGRILEEESYFSGDNDIATKYKVDVHRIIKDGTSEAAVLSQSLGRKIPEPLTTPLRFSRFGGTVQVNEHRASMRVKGSELLTSDRTYILFLQWTGWNYSIAGGMSGAVLVKDDSSLQALGTNRALQLKKYNQLSLEAFIKEILREPVQ
jgi:hypothetical protein